MVRKLGRTKATGRKPLINFIEEEIFKDPIRTQLVFNTKLKFRDIGAIGGIGPEGVKHRWNSIKSGMEKISTKRGLRGKEYRRFIGRVLSNALINNYKPAIYSAVLTFVQGKKSLANLHMPAVLRELPGRLKKFDPRTQEIDSFLMLNALEITASEIQKYKRGLRAKKMAAELEKLKKQSDGINKQKARLADLKGRLLGSGVRLLAKPWSLPGTTELQREIFLFRVFMGQSFRQIQKSIGNRSINTRREFNIVLDALTIERRSITNIYPNFYRQREVRLTNTERLVVYSVDALGMNRADIARALGREEETVKAAYRNARKKLGKRLGKPRK